MAYLDGKPIGVIDIHRDHPSAGISYIGLLLIEESRHRCGIGRAVYLATEDFIFTQLASSVIRLGVSENNDVDKFWSKMGFTRNGRSYQWPGHGIINEVFEMEKKIF